MSHQTRSETSSQSPPDQRAFDPRRVIQWYLRVPRANERLQMVLDELSRTQADTDEGLLWVAHQALDRMSLLASPREVEELAILLAGASLRQRPFFVAIQDILEMVLQDPLGALTDYFRELSFGEARAFVGAIVREALASTSLDIDGVDAIMHAQVTYLTEGRGPAQRASRAAAIHAVCNASSHGDAAARALVVVATLDAYLAKFDGDGAASGLRPPAPPLNSPSRSSAGVGTIRARSPTRRVPRKPSPMA